MVLCTSLLHGKHGLFSTLLTAIVSPPQHQNTHYNTYDIKDNIQKRHTADTKTISLYACGFIRLYNTRGVEQLLLLGTTGAVVRSGTQLEGSHQSIGPASRKIRHRVFRLCKELFAGIRHASADMTCSYLHRTDAAFVHRFY